MNFPFNQDSIVRQMIVRIETNCRLLLWLSLGLLVVFAFAQRYPMDDAFISYRYAKYLALGQGLVWNAGERVEGYTNFLWTIFLAGGMKLGIAPERFSVILSFPFYVAALWMTFRLTLLISGSSFAALAGLLIVGFNRSVYAFSTSGLETTFQMCQFLAIILLIIKMKATGWSVRGTALLSAVLGISLLTRLDAAIPASIAAYTFYKSNNWKNKGLLIAAIVPVGVLVLPWLSWKMGYYGSILPNSFHVKVRGFENVFYGIFYLHLFALANLLHVHLGILIFYWKSLKNLSIGAIEAGTLVALWMAYTAFVGGDFMEFRFLVPITPILIALLIAIAWQFKSTVVTAALMVGLALGTIQSNFALQRLLFGYGVESVGQLRAHLNGRSENWVLIGQKLKERFGGSDVMISVGASGAIPYYSELKTVDFLGLTDREIASDNEPFSAVPGHRVICSLDYLARRGVNMIVEPNNHMMTQPQYSAWQRSVSWREAYQFYLDPDRRVKGETIDQIELFAMPVDEEHTLIIWYLKAHPLIDRVIAEQKWKVFTISRW